MSSQLNKYLKDAGLFVLTIGGAAAVFLNMMYSEQRAQDYDSTQLKARCEALSIKISGGKVHETT